MPDATHTTTSNATPPASFSAKAARFLLWLWIPFLVLAISPLTQDPVTGVKHVVTALFLLLVACCWLISRDLDLPSLLHPIPAALIGFWLIQGLGVFTASLPMMSLDAFAVSTLWVCITFVTALCLRSASDAWRTAVVLVVSVGGASLYGLAQKFGWDPFPWVSRTIEEYRGLPSTFGNPNFAGHTLALVLPVSLGLWRYRRHVVWLVPAVLMALHLYWSRMRSAPLSLAVAGIFVLCVAWELRRSSTNLRRAVAAALVVVGSLVLSAWVTFRLVEGHWFPRESSLLLRYNSYWGASRMWLDKPVLGHGTGNYEALAPAYWTPYEQAWFTLRGRKNDHVHNEYLEAAAENGFLGLFAWLALIFAGIQSALRLAQAPSTSRRYLGYVLLAAFIAFATDSLFGFNAHVPVSRGIFALYLGLAWSLSDTGTVRTFSWRARGLLLLVSLGLCSFLWAGWAAEILCFRARAALQWVRENPQQLQVRQSALVSARQDAERACRFAFWKPTTHTILGAVALEQGDISTALTAYNHAAELLPYDPSVLTSFAGAWLRYHGEEVSRAGGNDAGVAALEQALHWAERALTLSPEYGSAREIRGRVALLRAMVSPYDEAGALYRQAVEDLRAALAQQTVPQHGLYKLLASAYERLGNDEEALRWWRQSVMEAPEDVSSWEGLERVAQRVHAEEDMLTLLSRFYPRFERMYVERGQADGALRFTQYLVQMHYFQVARHITAALLKKRADNFWVWGEWFRTSKDTPMLQLPENQTADEIGESDAPTSLRAALHCADTADAEAASTYLTEIQNTVALLPYSTAQKINAERAFFYMKATAHPVLAALTAVDRLRLQAIMGELAARSERWDEAVTLLRSATEIPENALQARAWAWLGYAFAGAGRLQEARESQNRADALAAEDPLVRYLGALLNIREGNRAAARFTLLTLGASVRADSTLYVGIQEALDRLQHEERRP